MPRLNSVAIACVLPLLACSFACSGTPKAPSGLEGTVVPPASASDSPAGVAGATGANGAVPIGVGQAGQLAPPDPPASNQDGAGSTAVDVPALAGSAADSGEAGDTAGQGAATGGVGAAGLGNGDQAGGAGSAGAAGGRRESDDD
jgi:hypothetical protein